MFDSGRLGERGLRLQDPDVKLNWVFWHVINGLGSEGLPLFA